MEQDLRSQIKELERISPLPNEQKELLAKAYDEIGQLRISEKVPKAGEEAPDFTLPNPVGTPVSLSGALSGGPAVVTFYRGIW